MKRRESVLFAVSLVAFVSLGLPDAVLGVAWPSIRRDFTLPLDRLGFLLFAAMTGYLLASILTGPLVRRLGVGGLLVASSALVVTSACAYAVSESWPGLASAAVLAGLGGGAIDAGINAYAAARFPAGRVAWLHASYGVGAALGPLLMAGVLARGASWRWGYACIALLLGVLGLGFLRTRDLWNSEGATQSTGPDARFLGSLGQPGVWANIALFFLYTGVEATAGQWAYSLFTEGRGTAPALAGVAVSGYWASLTAGRLVSGAMTRTIRPVTLLRSCLAAAPVWALLLAAARGPFADVTALALFGFTVGPVFPLLIAETTARVGAEHSANAVGLQIAAACLGTAALPALAGVFASRHGLEALAAFLVGAALLVLFSHEAILAREHAK